MADALRKGASPQEIHALTKIDLWFLYKIQNIIDMENALKQGFDQQLYLSAKRMGFLDAAIEEFSGRKVEEPATAVFKLSLIHILNLSKKIYL